MTINIASIAPAIQIVTEVDAKIEAAQARLFKVQDTLAEHEARMGNGVDSDVIHAELDKLLAGQDNTFKTMLARCTGAKTPAHIAAEKRVKDTTVAVNDEIAELEAAKAEALQVLADAGITV